MGKSTNTQRGIGLLTFLSFCINVYRLLKDVVKGDDVISIDYHSTSCVALSAFAIALYACSWFTKQKQTGQDPDKKQASHFIERISSACGRNWRMLCAVVLMFLSWAIYRYDTTWDIQGYWQDRSIDLDLQLYPWCEMWNSTIPKQLAKQGLVDKPLFDLYQQQFATGAIAPAKFSVLRMLKRRLPLTGDSGFVAFCSILSREGYNQTQIREMCTNLSCVIQSTNCRFEGAEQQCFDLPPIVAFAVLGQATVAIYIVVLMSGAFTIYSVLKCVTADAGASADDVQPQKRDDTTMRQQDRAENEKQITDEKQQKQDHEIPKPTVREPKLSGQQQRETDDWKVDQLELRAGYGQCGWTDLSLQIESRSLPSSQMPTINIRVRQDKLVYKGPTTEDEAQGGHPH